MSLVDLIPTSIYNYQGKTPPSFDLGPGSTLDNQSSLNGNPAFTSYSDPYLRTKMPTRMAPPASQLVPYLSNPPK